MRPHQIGSLVFVLIVVVVLLSMLGDSADPDEAIEPGTEQIYGTD
jgi:hypothetical protein